MASLEFLNLETETFTFPEKLLRRLGVNLERKSLRIADPEIPAGRNKGQVLSRSRGAGTFKAGLERQGTSLRECPSVQGELTWMPPALTALKEKGNAAFVRGDYEMAIHCYSEGLEKLKDMKVLYTNRAQVSESGTCPRGFLRARCALSLGNQRSLRPWCQQLVGKRLSTGSGRGVREAGSYGAFACCHGVNTLTWPSFELPT